LRGRMEEGQERWKGERKWERKYERRGKESERRERLRS
jgi:hypothetical protein